MTSLLVRTPRKEIVANFILGVCSNRSGEIGVILSVMITEHKLTSIGDTLIEQCHLLVHSCYSTAVDGCHTHNKRWSVAV